MSELRTVPGVRPAGAGGRADFHPDALVPAVHLAVPAGGFDTDDRVQGRCGMLKNIVGGTLLGVVLFSIVVAMAEILVTSKPAIEKDPCYIVATIKPELGVAVVFNACTGQFGLSRFPSNVRRAPTPDAGSTDGAFLRRRPGAEI